MNDDQIQPDDAADPSLMPEGCGEAENDIDHIYRTFVPMLRQIAERRGVPLCDADDRVHDVFASFIVHRADVRDPGPYLMGAMRNAASEYWRSQGKERAVFSDADDVESESGCEDGLVDAISARVAVSATLAALGPSCRDALRLYYFDGETAADIAQQRETSTGYIHRLLTLCRQRALAIYTSFARVL